MEGFRRSSSTSSLRLIKTPPRERVNQERPEDETVRKIPEWQPTRALAQVNTLDPHYRAVQIAKVIESDMAIFNGSPDDNHKAFPDSLKNKDLDREIRVMNKSLAQARGTKTAKAAGKKLSVQVTGPTVRIVTKDEPNDIKIDEVDMEEQTTKRIHLLTQNSECHVYRIGYLPSTEELLILQGTNDTKQSFNSK
ncbi:hypothetical protein G7Y79_00031g066250 [Physcia stellaris]|nr:hypothetical protein G7Y79_00031g066250 [Physcia stellaris]